MEKIIKQLEELREKVQYNNHRYFVLDDPEISDSDYDHLFKKLMLLEKEYPDLAASDSPCRRVGAESKKAFSKINHRQPMLSLENGFDEQDIIDFDNRIKRFLSSKEEILYTVEPKIDGLAVELVYEKGLITAASTRGNGMIGEDITANVKTIPSIPFKLTHSTGDRPVPELLEVRGEIYMEIEAFRKLNSDRVANNQPIFINPRSAAAGSVRQLDPGITAQRRLDMLCYGIGEIKSTAFKTQKELIIGLKEWGFKVNDTVTRIFRGTEAVIMHCKMMEAGRHRLPYEMDGMVIKVNDLGMQSKLGAADRCPHWAFAYKFKSAWAEVREPMSRAVAPDFGKKSKTN